MATGCLLRLVTLGFQSSWFKVTIESATVRSLVDDDGRVLAKLWRGHGHTGLYRRGHQQLEETIFIRSRQRGDRLLN